MTTLRSRAPALISLLLAILTAIVFIHLAEREPSISDQLGYLYAGERLATGHGPTYEDKNNAIAGPYFALYAFQVRRTGSDALYLGFPPGFPLLLATPAWLTSQPEAMHAVVPLLAAGLLMVTYLLGKLLSGDQWTGLWAAVVLLATPAFWQFGTAAWSEIPAALAVTLGTSLFLLARQRGRGAGWSLLAALVLSFGHFIRYTNVVFLGALALYDLYTARRRLLNERRLWLIWIAAAGGLVAIPIFNLVYYGGPLITSYSPTHGWYPLPPFDVGYALGPSFVNGYSLRESLRTLWQNFSIGLVLAVAGWWRLPVAERVLTVAAIGLGLLAYAFYAFAPSGINSRFLLPIFPFMAVAIGRLASAALGYIPWPALRWFAGLALGLGLCYSMWGHWTTAAARNANNGAVVAVARDITQAIEPDAVVLSYAYNDMIAIYGRRSVLNYRRIPISDGKAGRFRLEMFEPCLVGAVDRLLARATPVYYVEDSQPPYWDSLAILQRHFKLETAHVDPTVYRLVERTSNYQPDEASCGFP